MTTLRWILFLLQIGALWLLFSGQVDSQWFPWITLGQLVALCLAITAMHMQHKSKAAKLPVDKVQADKIPAAQPRQRRKSTFHPSHHPSESIPGLPEHAYQAPSPYEEQPQTMYADRNE